MSESTMASRQRFLDQPTDAAAFEDYERELVREQDMAALVELYRSAPEALREQVPNWWMRLLRHLDQAVSRETDADRRAGLHLEIGQVYELALDRPDQAIAAYQQAFRVSSDRTEALDRARAIYAGAGNWDMVLRLWELQLRGGKESAQRAEIYVAMGRVCLDHIGDGARATDFARHALADVPGHEGAQAILSDYADSIRDWRGEVELRVRDAQALEGAQRVEPLLDTLRFVVERVPRDQADGTSVAELLAQAAPEDRRTWEWSRAWYDRIGDAAAAERAHTRLVGLLDGEERVDALREAARRAHALDLVSHEIAARRGLLVDAPTDTENFRLLEALVASEENPGLMFQILEDALAGQVADPAELSLKAARLASSVLERDEDAERYYGLYLEHRPSDVEALTFLLERARAMERTEAIYALAPRLAAERGEIAADLWAETARVAEFGLHSLGKAIAAWRAHLVVAEDTLEGRSALHRLLKQTENWEELAVFLEEELPRDEDAAVVAAPVLREELAKVYATYLDAPAQALVHADAWVGLEPANARAGETLRSLASSLENWPRVRRDLEARIEATEGDERIALVDELARLELTQGRRDVAQQWLDQLVDVPTTELGLLRERLAMALEHDDVDAVLRVQGVIVERARGESTFVDESMILGEYAENLGHVEPALHAYQAVLAEVGPSHERARAGAIRMLAETGRSEELAQLLAVDARLHPNADTHERLAVVYEEHLFNGEQAASERQSALNLNPRHEAAAAGLLRWFADRGAWAEIEAVGLQSGRLGEAWESMFDAWQGRIRDGAPGESLPEELERVHEQLQDLANLGLGDRVRAQRAATARAQVLASAGAWTRAADYAERSGDVAEEYRLIVEAARASEAASEAAARWSRAAALAESHGLGESGGWDERQNAWLMEPFSEALREALAQSAERCGHIARYAELLDEALPTFEGSLRVDVLRELGRLRGARLNDEAGARASWEALLAEREDDAEALREVLAIYRRPEDAALARVVLERLIAQTEGEERFAHAIARARILDEVLELPDEALSAWQEIRAQRQQELAHATRRVESLLRQQERWDELVAFFSEELALAEDASAAAAAMVARGRVSLEALGNQSAGIQDLMNVLRNFGTSESAPLAAALLDPMVEDEPHADVAEGIFDWLERQDRADDATKVLERRVASWGSAEGGRWRRLLERLRQVAGREADTAKQWIAFQYAHIPSRDEAGLVIEWALSSGYTEGLLRAWSEALTSGETLPEWWIDAVNLSVARQEATDEILAALAHLRTLEGVDTNSIDDQRERVLREANRSDELVDAIVTRAAADEGKSAVARYISAAAIAEERLADASRAGDIYLQAIQTGASEPELVFEAFRNYFSAKRWSDAAQLLRDGIETHPESEFVGRWKALLASAMAAAGEPDEDVFAALREASTHLPILTEVSDGLEHLSFSEKTSAPVAREAAQLLLSLGVEELDLEVDLRERVVSLTEDPQERHESLLAVGALLEGIPDQHERAWEVYAEALALVPSREETADALERLGESTSTLPNTAELFVVVATNQSEAPVVPLFERALAIAEHRLGDLSRASGYQETLIAQDGPSEQRFAKLVEGYETQDRAEAAVDAIDRWAQWALEQGDTQAAQALYERAAELVEARIGNGADAVRRWRRIADEDESRRGRALEELARHFRDDGAWAALDAVISERLAIIHVPADREVLLREQALVRQDELRADEPAIEAWEALVSERPDALDALAALETLYRGRRDGEQVYQTLARRFAQTGDIEDQLALARAGLVVDAQIENSLETLSRLAVHHEPVAADAIESLAHYADEHPEHISLAQWILLAQVRDDAGDLPGAARANLAIAAQSDDDAIRTSREWLAVEQRVAASWSVENAALDAIRLWTAEDGNPERLELVREATRMAQAQEAFSSAAEAVVEQHGYEWLRRFLVRWYDEEGIHADRRRTHLHVLYAAAPTDDELYEALLLGAQDDERVHIWRQRLVAAKEDAERQPLRASIGLALADADDEEKREEAQRYLEQYRMGHSANDAVNQSLRKLYAQGNQWQQLSNLIEEELWLTDASAARVRLLVERARCREAGETLDSMVVEGWFDVLTEDPAEVQAIDALSELSAAVEDPFLVARIQDRLEGAYERVGRWRALYELLLQRSAEGLPGERFDLLSRAANVASEQLRDDAMTYRTLCRMVELKPADRPTLERARVLAFSLDQTAPLRDAIAQGLQNTALDADDRALLRRTAALLRAHQPEEMADAITDLSALFDARPDWAIVDDVAMLLGDDTEALVRWMEARTDGVDAIDIRVKLLREASNRIRPQDPLHAGALLELLYALSPSESVANELDTLYARENAHEARIRFWREILADNASVIPAMTAHRQLHDALRKGAAPWEEVILHLGVWRDALEDADAPASSQSAWKTALDQSVATWTTIPDGSEREGDLLDALVRRVDARGDLDTLFRARVRIAASEERADRLWDEHVRRRAERSVSDAWASATEALRDAPTRESRAALVEGLAHQQGNYEEATAFLRHLAMQDFDARHGLALRFARMDVQKLKLLERATDTLSRILDSDPTNTAARGLLREVLVNASRPELRRRVVEKLIQTSREPAERASLVMTLVFGAHERGDIHESTSSLERALKFDPGHAEARRFLLDKLNDARYLRLAETVLLPILREEDAKTELGKLLGRLVEVETVPARKAKLNEEIATLQEGEPMAVMAWLRALKLHPHSPSYLEHAVLAIHSEDDAAVFRERVLEMIQPTLAADVQSALFAAVGRVELESLADIEAGERHLNEALARNPGNENALRGLEGHYLSRENYDGLASVLQTRLTVAEDDETRRTVAERLVVLLRGELNRPAEAAKVLETLVGMDPNNEVHLETLRGAYYEAGDVKGEIRTLERLATMADEDERVVLLTHALTLCQNEPSLSERALALANALLLDDPQYPEALLARETALLARGDRRAAFQAQASIVEYLGDDLAAISAFERALTLDSPTREEARLTAKMAGQLFERAMMDDAQLPALTTWISLMAPADVRPLVRPVTQMPPTPERRAALVALLQQLRPGTDEALGTEVVEAILADDGECPAAILALAQWFDAAADVDDAIREYRRLLATREGVEERGETLLRIASLEERRENYSEALRVQMEALDLGLESASLYDALVRGFERAGEWESVANILERRAERLQGMDRAKALRRAGQVARERLGDATRSEKNLRAAIAAGDQGVARVDLLELMALTGQSDQVMSLAQELRRSSLSREDMHRVDTTVGMFELQRRNYAEARTWLESARGLNVSHARTLLLLGRAYIGLRQWNEALEALQAALVNQDQLQLDERAMTLVLLGRVQLQEGGVERAREFCARALRLRPEFPQALELLAELDRHAARA